MLLQPPQCMPFAVASQLAWGEGKAIGVPLKERNTGGNCESPFPLPELTPGQGRVS